MSADQPTRIVDSIEEDAPGASTAGSLPESLERFGVPSPSTDTTELIDRYCHMLWKLNEELNLTRHTSFDLFVSRDLLDTVELSKLIKPGESVLDVGTGGGVPGLVLAMLRPDIRVALCDSVAKKAHAVDGFAKQLGLSVPVHAVRAQEVLEHQRFDTLVSRAVGPLAKQCFWFKDYWHRFHRLLTIKGPRWTEERAEARHLGRLQGIELRKVAEYRTPITQAVNVILQLKRPVDD